MSQRSFDRVFVVENDAVVGDQAEGLRRLLGAPAVTLTVAARDMDVIGAYARIKHVAHERRCEYFRIVISHARSAAEAQAVFDNMRRVAHDHLGVRLEYLGMAPSQAVQRRACADSVL